LYGCADTSKWGTLATGQFFFESKYSKGGPCCEILLKKAKHTLQLGSGSTPPIGIWLTGLKPRKTKEKKTIYLSVHLKNIKKRFLFLGPHPVSLQLRLLQEPQFPV
jgi:hypothetical protein